MSLTRLLPVPTQQSFEDTSFDPVVERSVKQIIPTARREPPPYGKRKGWVPRSLEDFGNGGAFPEIHIAQYPLNMGKKKKGGGGGEIVPLQVDAEGTLRFDALARIGQRKDKVIHTSLVSMTEQNVRDGDPSLELPDEEEIEKTTEETRAALEKLVQSKIAAAQPVRAADKQAPTQYIRYTPAQQGAEYNSGAKQRIIRMVEAQKDPMSPPRFKTNKKIPRGPPSPPAPVLHSPTRKVTAKEQQDWKIPPCISNWKNPKGYTIPLDKRLAADGRGLQEHTINDNFAKLSQALYMADREARKAVEARAQIQQKLAQKQKESKEEQMRILAAQAREMRAGIRVETANNEEDEEARQRDELRYDRHKERERKRRLEKSGKSKLTRDKDRDITEQVALGMPSKATVTHDSLFDQRLFGQTKGLDSGLGMNDDSYNVYDKPWREGGSAANAVYRPSRNVDKDIYGDDIEKLMKTSRFVPDKGFSGSDPSQKREGPVQFERESDDPFGLNLGFLTDAKKAKRPTEDRDSTKSKRSKH